MELGCLPQSTVALSVDLAAERQAHAIERALAERRLETILARVGVTAARQVHVLEDGVQFPGPQPTPLSPARKEPAAPAPAGTSFQNPPGANTGRNELGWYFSPEAGAPL